MAQLFGPLLGGAKGAGAGTGGGSEGNKAGATGSGTCSVARAIRGGGDVGGVSSAAGLRIGLEKLVVGLGLGLSGAFGLTDGVDEEGGGCCCCCCNQRGTNSVAATRGTNSEAVTRNAVATGMGVP